MPNTGPIIGFVGGLVIGVPVGYFLPSLFPLSIPSDIDQLLSTLTFKDTTRNLMLVRGPILKYQSFTPWDIWLIGYGLAGDPPDDIIVDIGSNKTTGEVSATIGKFAWDAIDILKSGIVVASLALFLSYDSGPVTGQWAIKLR